MKRQIDEGKNTIVDLETNRHDKFRQYTNLQEVVMLRKWLKEVKEQIDKNLKLKGGNDVLNEMLSAQEPSKNKRQLGFDKGECSKTPSKVTKERKTLSRMNLRRKMKSKRVSLKSRTRKTLGSLLQLKPGTLHLSMVNVLHAINMDIELVNVEIKVDINH